MRDQNWRDIFSRFRDCVFPLKHEGERPPWWTGPAWLQYETRRARLAPYGLHLLIRWVRVAFWWLRVVGFPDSIYRERQRWVVWEREFWQRRLADEQINHGVTQQELLNAESRGYARGWNDHVNKTREELKRRVD